MECTGIGFAFETSEGPCEKEPSIDLAVKLMEKAIEKAQAEATKMCAEGCKCEGVATPIGPPTCHSFDVNKATHHLWQVTAVFDGKCVCPDDEMPKAPAAPLGALVADGWQEFFAKVKDLPELPEKPAGNCHMYRHQKGHAFPFPICSGKCKQGVCKTFVEVVKNRIIAYCDCR